MTKRDVVMGVVMGAAGVLLVWFLSGAISEAASDASGGANPARSLGLVVGLGLLVLALSNVAAMRARTRRNDRDDWWS
jgi:purine-cytosine permease-like protein